MCTRLYRGKFMCSSFCYLFAFLNASSLPTERYFRQAAFKSGAANEKVHFGGTFTL